MFEFGFWEILLIGVVALLVVGPERLPGVARTAGIWVGRARRFVASVKTDIDREVRSEELRKILDTQNEFKDAYDIVEETKKEVEETQKDINDAVSELNKPDANDAKRDADDKPTLSDESDTTKSADPAQSDGEKRTAG